LLNISWVPGVLALFALTRVVLGLCANSIAILGWLDAEEFTGNVERAVKWLSTECAGTWHS